jgi:hypothetical protein
VAAQSAKPPWNQPHVVPLALSRSPIFLFFGSVDVVVSRVSHLSPVGCGSPMTVVLAVTAGLVVVKPWVCPATRLSAPGVEGPNVVP